MIHKYEYKYTNIWNSWWQAKGETKKTKRVVEFVPDILRALHPHPFNQLFQVSEQSTTGEFGFWFHTWVQKWTNIEAGLIYLH